MLFKRKEGEHLAEPFPPTPPTATVPTLGFCPLSPLLWPSQDVARLQGGRQPEHRDVTLQKVLDSEKLLYVLEADAAIAKHMKHPQGDMIAEE